MSVISWHERPAPAGPAAASLAFAFRSLLKIKHVPEQLGDVIGIPVLFTLLFTYLFGGRGVNPVSHLITAARALMAGTATTPQVLWAVAAAGLLIAVFAPLTALLYQRK